MYDNKKVTGVRMVAEKNGFTVKCEMKTTGKKEGYDSMVWLPEEDFVFSAADQESAIALFIEKSHEAGLLEGSPSKEKEE
jgi:hypothetical protein